MFETKSYRGAEVVKRIWWGWCWKYRKLIILNFILIAIFSALNGAYAPMIKFLVDGFQAGGEGLSILLLAALAIAFGKAATLLAHRMLNNRIFSRVSTDLQRDMFSHIVDADMAWHGLEPAAMRAARVTNEVGVIKVMLERVTNNLIRDSLMIVSVFISMLWIDWELTLVALVVFPIAIWPVTKISKLLRKLGAQTQVEAQRMAGDLQESMDSIRIVKAYGLESPMKTRLRAKFEHLRHLGVRAADHSALIDPIMEVLGGIAVVGVLLLVGQRLESGANTLGDFAGFIAALLLAAQPMRGLGNVMAAIQHGIAAGQRVLSVLDEAPRVVDPPSAPALRLTGWSGGVADRRGAALRFEEVSFSYEGDAERSAVDRLDLEIPGGQRVALVGRSGAGKSTLFNLIPRLYDPTRGRILVEGQDLRAVSVESLRNAIALVTQEAILFNDTVAANIAAGRPKGAPEPSRDDIVAAAQAAAAHEFVETLPGGYDAVIGDRGDKLSGGQRQRISIARAFLRDAPILLLDEATSALDSESEQKVKDALDRLSRGRTTIAIAHRLSTILDSDQIVVLEKGRLVEQGPHAELLEKGGIYANLYKLQYQAALAEAAE